MNYNFKQIKVIAPSKELINIVLSKTQRKTPTVVHPQYDIGRIRSFYMRKVKFTQATIAEKLSGILEDFPKLDDIHPFYADLINVLYDKDHYKLALGHVHSAKNIIENIGKDYVRLLKYGDSLYRCKMLKKAALGRMCTMLKKLTSSLQFLEEVRKHLARLPSINPFERTLLITGYPNVGKSSFINQITNANVEVQPYPFTTQSLYVGHTDYNYVRWQVIDSPGILDHPLENRNTIEMQSITALAHLKACVLFFIDISETCGPSIIQQISLFNNIKPLFQNKPLVIVLTKSDLKRYEDLEIEDKEALDQLAKEQNVQLLQMSNKNGEGINDVKSKACDILLKFRLEHKPEALAGGNAVLKNEEEYLKGHYVAQPKKRDNKERPPTIPDAVKRGEKLSLGRPNLKEIQEQMGGAGVFNFPLQEHYILENPEWKYDVVPEFFEGKNVYDFVDPDIEARLEELEREEEMLEKARENQMDDEESDLGEEFQEAHSEVKTKRALLKLKHKLNKNKRSFPRNIPLETVKERLIETGKETEELEKRVKAKRRGKKLSDLARETEKMEEESEENEMEDEDVRKHRSISRNFDNKKRSISRSRSKGFKKEVTQVDMAMERMKKKIEKQWKHMGKAGEADRRIVSEKPRHLFSGKKQFKGDRR